MIDDGFRRRAAWVTGLRLFVFSALLAVALLVDGRTTSYPVTRRLVFWAVIAAYVLSALQLLALRAWPRPRIIAFAQVAFDQILWTFLVFLSGGGSSGATSLYGLTVLAAAILLGLRGAIFAAAIGLTLYVSVGIGLVRGLIAPPSDQFHVPFVRPPSEAFYPVMVNGAGLLLVLALAGYLAERLRATGGELALAKRRYDEAERLAGLGRIAAWLAHEIRNPLGSIAGAIELLRESPELSMVDRQLCDIVLRESSRLNGLVGDMLDLSKHRAPMAQAVDVAEIARDLVALARRSAAAKGGVQVAYSGPDGNVLARCDGAQIRQVGWNLVRNALQSSEPGSVITVAVSAGDGEVCLCFDDEGPGVAPDARAQVFDTFYTTRALGTGIGLAVVKRIIDEHASMGASIEVAGAPGGGASFRVTLSADVAGLSVAAQSVAPRALAPRVDGLPQVGRGSGNVD